MTSRDKAIEVAEAAREVYSSNFPMNRQAVEEGIATQSEYNNCLFSFGTLMFMAANDLTYREAAHQLFPELEADKWSDEEAQRMETLATRNAFRVLYR